jgi:Arf-GAP/coiled-coil/ANK repeat/PH domain-containing protein
MGQQILKLQQEAEATRDKLKALNKAISAVAMASQAQQEAVVHFADSVAALGGIETFGRARDLLVDLASKRSLCAKKQEEHISMFVKDFVDVRIATSLGMQAKVHEAIKEHEGASERVHSLKKGSPKLIEAQATLAATQQQMDLLSFAFVNKLRQTIIDVSVTLIDKLQLCLGEETVLSMAINSQTTALIPELSKHQVELKKQRQHNDEERAKEMKRHQTSSSSKITSVPNLPVNHQIKQGYIFCRVSGKYRQRWVSILNARLMVYKDWKASEAEKTFNLVLCNVKPLQGESSHPYVFEVRSHMDEHMQFAATDELEMSQWINVIQTNIATQLGQNIPTSPSGTPSSSDQYHIITSVKGNDKCADCRAPDPEWISFMQGITICIECCGVHRSFGSHISKVRSMKLDALEPEMILLMTSIGNFKANTKVFEFSMPEGQRIAPNADRANREAFLKAKYVERRWIPVIEDWAAHITNLMRRKNPFKAHTVLGAMVHTGADINWHRPGNQKTLLHKCVTSDNLTSALLLLKRECAVDPVDSAGMTPLHHAAQINSAPMARLLLQHGASMSALDQQRRTPRDVAIDNDAVDCIVLLDEDLNNDAVGGGAGSPLESDSILAASAASSSGNSQGGKSSGPVIHSTGPRPNKAASMLGFASTPVISLPSNLTASPSGQIQKKKGARPFASSTVEPMLPSLSSLPPPVGGGGPYSPHSAPNSAHAHPVHSSPPLPSPLGGGASSYGEISDGSPHKLKMGHTRGAHSELAVHIDNSHGDSIGSTEEKRSNMKRVKSAKSVSTPGGMGRSPSGNSEISLPAPIGTLPPPISELPMSLPPPLLLPDPPSLPGSPMSSTPKLPLPLPPPSSSKESSGPKSARK